MFELSLADLNNDEDQAFRKIKLVAEDVQGYNILTNFHGMDMTRDKLSSLIKKWQTLIEAHVDVRTTDNYTLRLFCVAFTTKMPNQVKKTCYAQSSQIREIRKKMTDIMREEASKCELKDLVLKLCVAAHWGRARRAPLLSLRGRDPQPFATDNCHAHRWRSHLPWARAEGRESP